MKKLLAFVLVLALCLSLCTGLTACVKEDTGSGTSSTQSGLDAALKYVKTLYKETTEKTSRDFTRIGSVPVNGVTYEVVWSVDVSEEYVKVVKNADGSVTIDVNETSPEEVHYTLTATISMDGKVVSFSWKHIVPKVNLDFGAIVEEAYALEQGASMDQEVTLTGVISKVDTPYDDGYKNITVTMDVIGVEGKPIQCYRLKGEGAETLKPGDTITVSGILTNYQGKIQFQAGCALLSVTPAGEVEAPTDVATIMKEAFELEVGGSTKYQATLTGKITKINTPYNPTYKNVSVTMEVEGYADKPILCYRVKGEGADSLLIGDTITVKGYIVNYEGGVQFGEGSALLKVEKTGSEVEAPSDPKQIVKEAYALKEDETLPYKATLTGKITKIDEAYNPAFGNITVTIVVEGMTDKPIKCFRLAGKGVENNDFGVGDTITVTGNITNYKGEVEYAQGCTLDKWENTVKDTIEELTVKEAYAMGNGMEHNTTTDKKYKVTGVIQSVVSDVYGNLTITDGKGNTLYIYGSFDKDGNRYDAMSSKPDEGDTVVLLGVIGNFNGPQMKNATIVSFTAGEFTVPSYEELGLPATDGAEITLDQANKAGEKIPHNMYTENKYKVTGEITEIKNTTYGNLSIKDADGKVLYIHGTFNADGSVRYDALEVKPIVGDTITVLGVVGNYNGTAQMKNGWIVEHTVPTTQLEVSFNLNYEGAGEAPDAIKVNPGTAYGTLPTPIREGWKFISWHKDAECTTEAVSPETIVDESHTLYAKWEEVQAIDPDKLAEMQAIVDAAYALTGTDTLTEKTLIGQIVEINEAYNEQYSNITVTMAVEGRESMAIKCYHLKGENAAEVAALAIGDTITVTGTLKVYSGNVQFDPANLVEVVKGNMPAQPEMTDAEIVDAAYAVEENRFLPGRYTLTGKIVSVDTAYSSSYGNITVTFAVEGKEDYPIQAYRLTGEGCDVIAVGDTITVTGIIKNYKGTVEFEQGCKLVSYEKPEPSGEQIDVSFDLNYEGAPAAPENVQVTVGAAYGELPTPEREGYTFGGWYTEETCTNAVEASTVVTATEAHTLYAKWTENSAVPEETMQDIVDAAYELTGSNTLANKTLTGKVIVINYPYSSSSNNISVTIAVEGKEDKPIQCYKLSGDGIDEIAVGDTVTVTGTIKNYNGLIEFDTGCTLDELVKGEAEESDGSLDLFFDYEKTNRVSQDANSQVWTQNGITFTNEKGSSTSNVGDYGAPARLYKSSSVTVAYPSMTKMIVTCDTVAYATALVDSIADDNATVTQTGLYVTIEFAEAVDSFAIASLTAQVRAHSIKVYHLPTMQDIVDDAYELTGSNTLANKTLTGKVIVINYPYSSSSNNISVTIAVEGKEDKPIQCYKLSGDGIDEIAVGDTVTVTGTIKNYNGLIEFDTGCTLDELVKGEAEESDGSLDLFFDYEKTNRVSQDANSQVWTQNGITFTNEKGSSTSNVGDYGAPARLYKSSSVTVAYPSMTKMIVTCDTVAYATALVDSIADDNATVTQTGLYVTIEFAEAVDSFAIASLTAQVRAHGIKIYAAEDTPGGETPDPVVCEVSFDLNYEGAGEGPEKITREVGAVYGELPPAPTREGFTFVGWFIDAEGTGEAISGTAIVSASHTLYAKWTENSAVPEETMQDIVDAAYELTGSNTLANKTLTGKVIVINYPYSSSSNNISVTIAVEGKEDKPIQCYKLSGDGIDEIAVGDTVTVTGTIKNYNGLIEFDTGCTLDELVKGEAEESDGSLDLFFDYEKTNRVSQDANSQVWTQNGITFTNEKGSSTSNVGDYGAPARLYKSSSVTVAYPSMTKMIVTCDTVAYATALVDSIADDNATVTQTGLYVTIEFAEAVDSFAIASLTAQVRAHGIKIYAAEDTPGGETPTPTVFDVTFDLNGAEGTAPATAQVSENASYGTLPTVEWEGYTFGGWYKNAECTGDAVTPDTEVTESHTLYAKWTENSSEGGSEEAVPTDITINFNTTAHRLSWDANSQVWANGGVTFTNDKASSQNDIIDSSNPVRLYAGSTITIACADMTQIVITSNGTASYKTNLNTSLTNAGATYSVSGNNYTITFAEPVDSFNMSLSGQCRFVSMTVTALVGGGSEGGSGSEGEGGEGGSEGEGEGSGTTTPTLTTPAEIVDAAYALAENTDLAGTYTLTGKVTSVKTAYDSYYGNVSVIMTVEGKEDKPILCFRMTGTGADVVAAGYTITVTGTLTNYNGTIEFKQGCTLDSYVEGSLGTENMTPAEIVDAAYALENGAYMAGNYTLTGVITSVDDPYDSGYKNVTVTIAVEGKEDKPIMCYRLKGTGADVIAVGDTITVSGILKNHQGTVEFDAGCTLDSYVKDDTAVVPPATGDHVEPEDVVYSKGTPSSSNYTNVVKNWGLRGDEATSLSPMATAFYTGENTYANLSAKSGSSDLSSVPQSDLYVALKTLMVNKHTKQTTYGEVRYLLAYTDCQNIDTSKLSLFYSGDEVSSTWDGGTTYNREHCWPKSHTTQTSVSNNGETGVSTDIMTIRPEAQSNNSSRSNTAYGSGSGYYFPNLTSTYDLRGDCARIVLYTYVRWNQTNLTDVIQSVDVLLSWIQADPVDSWELARNDSVQSITGTRNVFVDYPELAFILFGQSVPSNLVTPAA